MRQRIDEFDWSATPLGPYASWSPVLVAMVELVLSSRQPMFLAWGQEQTWIHNDAFISIAGSKHPRALGMPARKVWAEAWADLGPHFERVLVGESIALRGFHVGLDRQGTVENAVFDFSYTPVRAEAGGAVAGLFGVCIETTAQVESEKQQLAMADRERTRILDMSRDLFAVASFEGRLLSINPAWSRQLGRSEAELLATPFSQIIHPDDLQETASVIEALVAGRPVHHFKVRLLKADGVPISYAWSAVPELDPPNGTFYTVGRDITDERAALAELLAARDALRQSQKMEAVGQLTGGIAHDFNNLLGGVSASLQVLQKRLDAGKLDDAQRYIDLGMKSVRKAASLTQRLLAFSRRQTLDPKPIYINQLVSGVVEMIQRTLGPALEVETQFVAEEWASMIDASQLENSLLNLCINARDAMPDGGRLLIETSNEVLDSRCARELDLQAGSYVCLKVRDTGYGMDADVKARAFDPFFTTKPLGQGTGLGLSMVYGFVRQSGGQVVIESEVGVGTTVSIYLPRYRGAVEADEEDLPAEPMIKSSGERVLVIEDEPTIRMLVLETLKDAGYNPLGAPDGTEGLHIFKSVAGIQLLVTDVGLPGGMNGRQVADMARTTRPDLPILFITGYADKAAVGNGLLPQGMAVMTKPFELETLVSKVREMLDLT